MAKDVLTRDVISRYSFIRSNALWPGPGEMDVVSRETLYQETYQQDSTVLPMYMEQASNKATDVVAHAPTPRKGPRYVTHKQKFSSFPKVAVAAAAIAAISLSTGVRRQQRYTRGPEKNSRLSFRYYPATEFQPNRRHKRKETNAAVCEASCKQQCHRQFTGQSTNPAYDRSFHSSKTESSSEDETCMNCVKKESKSNCYKTYECAAQNLPRDVQHYPNCQPVGYHSQAQLPGPCLTFPQNRACHECCCKHQTPSHPNTGGRITPTSVCCLGLPDYYPIQTCCTQRMRQGINASPNLSYRTISRKNHGHHLGTCRNFQPQSPSPQPVARPVKAMKPVRPKPREQRVKARRIRHPVCDEDSNSETEMCAPVTDVRTLRSAATYSLTSDSPGQTMPLINRPERPQPAVCSSYPPQKVNPCPGPSVQVNALLTVPAGYSNIQPQGNGKESESTSSSSDSSKSSNIPGTNSSSSSNSDNSSDLSDSSSLSNEENGTIRRPTEYSFPQTVGFSQSTSQSIQPNGVQVINPIHTYYQNPHVGIVTTRSTPLPISSGDFWNVRRPWQRTSDGRRADVPGFAGTLPREGDNYPAQWMWMAQNSSLNPSVQQPRGR